MKTLLRCISIVVTLLVIHEFSFAMFQAAARESSRVQTYLAQGDEYAQKTFQNEKALKSYSDAVVLDPKNAEILWRISRSYVDIGEHMPSGTEEEKEKQLQYYEKALEFADKAIGADPNSSMAYTRRAIANGRIALFKGVWESLDLVKQTRVDCEKAIALDPNNNSAYYVLGRTHAKVSEKPKIVRWPLGLGWANLDDAVSNFEKAIAIRSNFIMYRLDCARAYIEMDEFDKARTHLNAIGSLPTEDEDDNQFRKEAKELLEKIKDK